jgi:hypothetical protein
MNHACIDLRSTSGFQPFSLAICNHNDKNMVLDTFFVRSSYLWLANPISPIIWLNMQDKLFGLPREHMRFEKHKPSFFPQYLVSIWSLQVSPLAAPKQLCAASKLSSEPTVPALPLLQKGEAAGDARTCHSIRNRNSLNPFSKRHVKANPLWWPRSARLIKRPLAKAYRLPLSIGCSLAMGGTRHHPIVQPTQIECNCHERFGQIFRLCLSPPSSSCRLVNLVFNNSRFYSRRSYLRALGGYC